MELLGLVDNMRAVEKKTLHGLPKVSVLAASSKAASRLDVLVTPVVLVRPGDDECLEIVALRVSFYSLCTISRLSLGKLGEINAANVEDFPAFQLARMKKLGE